MAGNNALAKLYSWADGVKRRTRNPMQTLALGLTQANEDLQQAATDADIAYGRNGMKSVLLSQQQRDEAAKRAAQFGEQMAMAAATVYHGSPHKFDKFDSSKIGTGEGAQAYGHGLYLAESPDVAKSYADALGYDYKYAGKTPKEGSPTDVAIRYLKLNQWDKEAAKSGFKTDGQGAAIRDAIDRLNLDKVQKPGNTYKVDLPDNAIAKMLDWDKPLSQQTPEVLQGLLDSGAFPGKTIDQLKAMNLGSFAGKNLDASGEYAWHKLINHMSGGNPFRKDAASRAASEKLKASGIPGIRYLDGGSRGAGAGTSNYVVFPGNENLLRILERNGMAP